MAEKAKKVTSEKERRIADEDRKSHRIHVGMTEEMFNNFHRAANKKGFQASTLIRLLILDFLKKE